VLLSGVCQCGRLQEALRCPQCGLINPMVYTYDSKSEIESSVALGRRRGNRSGAVVTDDGPSLVVLLTHHLVTEKPRSPPPPSAKEYMMQTEKIRTTASSSSSSSSSSSFVHFSAHFFSFCRNGFCASSSCNCGRRSQGHQRPASSHKTVPGSRGHRTLLCIALKLDSGRDLYSIGL